MIIKCAIIDDEPLAVELLVSYVKKIPFMQLDGKYSNAVDAMKGIAENPVDVVFLDIQMPELNGLELSRMLPEATRVVFTTAFEQYALDGYRINALDYLLKPISYTEFLEACNKALQWFKMVRQSGEVKEPEATSIFVKSEYKLLQINLDDIRYIEGLKDYVKIFMVREWRNPQGRPPSCEHMLRKKRKMTGRVRCFRIFLSVTIHRIRPVSPGSPRPC